ncbi:acyl-CoA dehydrogenase family protein [Natrinema sp. CBA1119]|uniref:acyl-CoA dehydrogenase family protein n=1 Tax=Natrinema sp. CBA1119 TaxID=1608465 RepID=UPI0020D2800B|nr:acyl-CoA dehydrogenase family protein [Natrinema sp. CBA1119]
MIRSQVRELCDDYWRERDLNHEYPTEFFEAFADGGWFGITIPEAYGRGTASRRHRWSNRRSRGRAPGWRGPRSPSTTRSARNRSSRSATRSPSRCANALSAPTAG